MSGPPPDLRTAPVEVVGRFATASNATLLVALVDAEGDLPEELGGPGVDLRTLDPRRFAVYKPEAGEAPLWDFPDGTLWRREVAACVVDRALDLRMVPTTIGRDDLPHGRGSLQRLVPHDPAEHYFALVEEGDPDVIRELQRMVAFDLLLDNADRKASHVLRERGTGRIRLVDHGVCFHPEPHLRTVGWHFAGEPMPAQDAALGARLVELLDAAAPAVRALDELLDAAERVRLRERARALAERTRFPQPDGRRPLPWPLL